MGEVTVSLGGAEYPWLTSPAELSGAGELVIEKFNDAQEESTRLWDAAIDGLNKLKDMHFDIDVEEQVFNTLDPSPLGGISLDSPNPPETADISIDWPAYDPELPENYEVLIDPATIPPFDVQDPDVNIPEKPEVTWPDTSVTPPSIEDVSTPSPPDVVLPPEPDLLFSQVPDPPEYNEIDFAYDPPADTLEAPETSFSWNEAEYSSTLYDYLREKVYNELILGGTGLDEDTEQAIYDRATARQELENQKLYDDALNFFASRGAPLPPGALNGALIEADYKIAQLREDLNNDILIQQSKLAQENTHFIIQSAINLEKVAIDYCNALQQRAFEAAKYTVESAHQLYLMKAEGLKIRTQIYQVLAQVYETRIRGEIAKAELYRSKIAGVEAGTNIQRAQVELYLGKIRGIEVLYNMYRTEMEAAGIKAGIEKLKIDRFRSIVESIDVQVRAATGRYTGYSIEAQAEGIKAGTYKSLVDGYNSRVGGIIAAKDSEIKIAQTHLAKVQSDVEVLKALVQKHGTDVAAKASEADAEVKIAGLDVDVFRSKTAKYAADIDGLSREYATKVEELKSINSSLIQQMDVMGRTLLGQYGLAVEVTKGIAQVAGQLGASAFAGVSASAHIGHGESRSDSASVGYQYSDSYSEQYSKSIVGQYIYYHERD